VRVVIGEDETLLRQGLVLLLEDGGFDVVGVAGDATTLIRVAAETAPDLVLTDVRMPPAHAEDGLHAAIAIRAARPETAIMVLSQYVHRQYARELLGTRPAGVGYLLKQRVADVAAFCRDIRTVAGGGTVLDPEVVSAMLSRARTTHNALAGLTPRQTDVFGLVAEGRTNAAIARELRISVKAVVQHVSHVYDHLGLSLGEDDHRRVLAVLRYLNP
jgi:DNA-binding NarL/FixJ family response regulator